MTPTSDNHHAHSHHHHQVASTLPKFLARLETNSHGPNNNGSGGGWDSALLSMVETNPFKQLTHLSLQFRPGNDSSIKLYLAGRLNQMLSKSKELSDALNETERKLEKEQSARKAMATELASIHQVIVLVCEFLNLLLLLLLLLLLS
jgi:spindle assembly abnormal protein 6